MEKNESELRDYFAGQSLAGCLKNHPVFAESFAKKAYELADAMMEARKKK